MPLTCEFANQAFTRADAGNDPPTSNSLEHVLAVPGHQMTVVNDVLLGLLQLYTVSVKLANT